MNIKTLTKGFKALDADIKNKLISTYYPAFFNNRAFPRYYMSLFDALMYKNKPTTYYGEYRGCMLVFKKAYIMNPVLYLRLPPMHKSGDIEIEKDVIKELAGMGIKTLLSDEDIKLYADTAIKTKRMPGNIEYIDKAGKYSDIAGKQGKNKRKRFNEFKKACKAGTIEYKVLRSCYYNHMHAMEETFKSWLQYKGKRSIKAYQHRLLCEPARLVDYVAFLINNKKNNEVYAITEKVAPGAVIYTAEVRNTNTVLKDPTKLIHYLVHNYYAKDVLINQGAAGIISPGLVTHKENLKPFKALQINETITGKKITKSEWEQACTGLITENKLF